MQHHARRGVIRQFLQPGILPRAVGFIADERMAEKLKMHADLMRATGVNLRLDERGRVQSFQHAITGVRGPAGIVVARGHAFAVRRMPGDGGVDFAGFAREFTAHNRIVNFFNLPPGELRRKREVRFVVFGDDEAAAGFLVEPVDDAGPRDAADAAERTLAVMEQGVDERVFLVSGGGMHDQPGGFVQHEQRLVLKKNGERDCLRLCFGGFCLRPMDFNLFAGARAVRGFGYVTIDADMALFNQPLQRAARGGRKFFAQIGVQPPGRERFFDSEFFRAHGHFFQRDM